MTLTPSSKKFLKAFGLRIRELRVKRNWTLEETENHGWKFWNHLQRIESGKKNINITTLLAISKMFKMSISDIMKGL